MTLTASTVVLGGLTGMSALRGTLRLAVDVLSLIAGFVLVVWAVIDFRHFFKDRDRAHIRDGVFLLVLGACDLIGAFSGRAEIADLENKVRIERAARAELEESLAPRQLTEGEAAAIIASVRTVGHCPRFSLQAPISNAEAGAYMEQLAHAFKQAGCDISGSGSTPASARARAGSSSRLGSRRHPMEARRSRRQSRAKRPSWRTSSRVLASSSRSRYGPAHQEPYISSSQVSPIPNSHD